MLRLWLVLGLFAAVFYIFSIASAALADRLETRGLPKAAWVVVVVFFPLIGGLLWFALGRRPLRGGSGGPGSGDGGSGGGGRGGGAPTGGGGRPGRGQQRTRRTGPVAPDDDPEFLARLAREQRHHDGDADA